MALGHQIINVGNQPVGGQPPPRPTPPPPPPPPPPLEEGPKFYDTSGPFFSLYSEVAKEEDNKMTERWQQDATDGILVFSGLFSAAVTVLLAVSIQDIRPNSQDISAIYLANIFNVVTDPNLTIPLTSIPSNVIIPPPFSPPAYAVWVNSLWFLSLMISLSCALLAMSLRQWAGRYTRLTQREGYVPEKRARTRAFFFRGVKRMRISWVAEALPALLHLSFFLFSAGVLIFLFNINHGTFKSVISYLGLFSFYYGWVTFVPVFLPDSPCYGPLSPAVWLIYAALVRVVSFIACRSPETPDNRSLVWRYGYRMSTALWKVADEVVARGMSLETDWDALRWTMVNTLGEDDKQEKFFQAIPGLLQSNQSVISAEHLAIWRRFWDVLDGFLHRTLSSDSVIDSVKTSRLDTYLNIINERFKVDENAESIACALRLILRGDFGQLPQTIKRTNILAHWCAHQDEHIALAARGVVARVLQSSQERDRSWVAAARDLLDIPIHDLCDVINGDDHSVSLVIFIQMTRQVLHSEPWNQEVLLSLSDFDIRKASFKVRYKFCTLWNQIVEEARKLGYDSDPVYVLHAIRRHYIALHQGTDATPTAFNSSTLDADPILFDPSSYRSCNIESHTAYHANPTDYRPAQHDDPDAASPRVKTQLITGGSTVLRQAKDASIVPRVSSSTEYPPLKSQGPPSSPPTTDLVHIPLQIATLTHPSLHDSIQMAALDLIRLFSTEISHVSRSSSLSSADPTANIVRPDPLSVTSIPSTVIRAPSVPLQQQLEFDTQQDMTARHSAPGVTETLSAANQNGQPNPYAGATIKTSEESTHIRPTTVSDSLSSPMMPAFHGGVILMVLPPSVESTLAQPASRSPSEPFTTAHSRVSPQVTSVQDPGVTTSNGTQTRSIPMESPTPDTTEHILLPGYHEHN